MEEGLLIELLIKGDNEAFRFVVDNYKSKVYNSALNFLQNADDAEDISQDVFIEVFKSIHSFKSQSKLSTWIYRITVTKSLELIRSRNRKKRFAVFTNLFSGDKVDEGKDFFNHPGVELENRELSKILFEAIGKLPENQKAAFMLHKIDGFSYKEVSGILDLSVSSIESLIFRAKGNLQKILGEFYENNYK